MTQVSTEYRPHEKVNHTRQIVLIGVFFFIFGFITWINGTLIPYLKIACQLEEWQAYFVTFAFYIAYTVMAIPSGRLLQHTGMIGGMKWGLVTMAIGCMCFIPAALQREYLLFLVGLFVVGTGLTILQTAVNPYITLLGPSASAARRISIMGICNKFAGMIAPIVFGVIILGNADELMKELGRLDAAALATRLDLLAQEVILPYSVLVVILLVLAMLIRFAHLPEIRQTTEHEEENTSKSLASNKFSLRLFTGFTAIFCTVGVEVVAGDTIGNYGLYQGMSLDIAKMLTSYTLAAMMLGYVLGTLAIPRYISQERAFVLSNTLALLILLGILLLPGELSVYSVALLGFANALLWPAIWPQALRDLKGKQLHQASAVLIMGIAGGAIMPLLYGWAAAVIGNQWAYALLIPCYLYNIAYWNLGEKERRQSVVYRKDGNFSVLINKELE